MHAILISSENTEKIIEAVPDLTPADVEFLTTCINKDRYFVTGFYNAHGKPDNDWMFFPSYLMERYEYDPVKIQTDWDQIVRK